MALKYFGGAAGQFTYVTKEVPPESRSEYPETLVITIIDDHYFDDYVRGKWMQLTLKVNQ